MAYSPARLDEIEKCIKMGQFSQAQSMFKQIRIKDIPRKYALRASSLARRCGKVNTSLMILNPIVRANKAILKPATSEEIVDYAFSLHRVGATVEAKKLFTNGDLLNIQQALFYYSIVLFSSWDYEKAIPYLEKYLNDSELDHYKAAIGKANLASALIFVGRQGEAQALIEEVLGYSKKQRLSLLEDHCTELQAQLFMSLGQANETLKCLQRGSAPNLIESSSLGLWTQKWSAIAEATLSPDNKSKQKLLDLQELARKQGQFEVDRDCDFYLAKIFGDQERVKKLYFGTPFKDYLTRLKGLQSGSMPNSYDLKLEVGFGGETLDLSTFERLSSAQPVAMSQLDREVLISLTRDFYKPRSLGSLFGDVFEEEYYDPFHSPNRMYQVVFRANEKFRDQGLDLCVLSSEFGYTLGTQKGFQLRVTRDEAEVALSADMRRYKKSLPCSRPFSILDLQNVSGASRRSLQRFLEKEVAKGTVERIGAGRSTKYKFVA